jgi:hypothetical protein
MECSLLKKKLKFLLVIILILPFLNALTLSGDTKLQTSFSNATITFSCATTLDNFTINSTDITLQGILSVTSRQSLPTSFTYNTINGIYDSCSLGISSSSGSGGGSSSTLHCYRVYNNKCIEQGFFTSCDLPYYSTMNECEIALNLSLVNITTQNNQTNNTPFFPAKETFYDNLKNNLNYVYNLPYFWFIVGMIGIGLIIYYLDKR